MTMSDEVRAEKSDATEKMHITLEGPSALTPDRWARVAVLDGVDTTSHLPSALSPSRAKDYMQCPRMFFYKTIAGFESPPTLATTVGTVAHWALEHLFDLSRPERTPGAAAALVSPGWKSLIDVDLDEPRFDPSTDRGVRNRDRALANARSYVTLFPAGSDAEKDMLARAEETVRRWFSLEDPTRFDPQARELAVGQTILNTPLYGIIDRLDCIVTDDGEKMIISDYKSGKPPRQGYELDAFFGMLTYAALLRQERGVLAERLRLIYPNHDRVVVLSPSTQMVDSHERKLSRVWSQILTSATSSVWPTKRSRLCDWCPFQADLCPEFNPQMAGIPIASDVPAATQS